MGETLEGVVERIVFASPDGAFAVVRIAVAGRPGPVTVIGPLSEITPGETLRLEGAWEKHAVHGEQFRAQRAVVEIPRTEDGVRRWLEGLPGIGPELARRLVAEFGVRTVEVLEEEAWRAAQVKGVGKSRAEKASKAARAKRQEREVMIFLQGLGVSLAYAARIQRTYGDQAIAKVQENPYRLARDVPGIGFQIADRIARGMGIDASSPLRIEAGVVHALDTMSDEGHVFAPRAELCERAAQALGVDAARAGEALERLINERALINEEDRIFTPFLHRAELELAAHLKRLDAADRQKAPALGPEAEHLAAGQKRALEQATSRGVGVITGGPGTGKTTVVRALVAAWQRAKRRVLLAAPTGRAAKRLSEATGRPAQTVHRLLEWGRPTGHARSPGSNRVMGPPFGRDASHPLEADLLVVDEASMLDLQLARGLCAAVPSGCTLVLVGDVDQLPSVGPGQVLADVIGSGAIPVARLTEIFRQAEGSGITENAYRILRGEEPEPGQAPSSDFHVIRADDPERARELVVKLCKERIPRAFGLDPVRDLQVLTPMHRGAAGTEELNRALQQALNPSGEAAGAFRVGDKVMQLRNDYDRDVFNGDVGRVVRTELVDGAPLTYVDIDSRVVEYDEDAADQLELAYAVSVHKSQGSEYPAVVLLLLPQHFLMLRRNLFYTAVTRGKKLVVVVGAPRSIRRAVEEGGGVERHTALADRLRVQ